MTGFRIRGLRGGLDAWFLSLSPRAPQRPNAGTPIDEELVEGLRSLTDAVEHEVDHGHDEMICVPAVKVIVGYAHSCHLSDADGPVPARTDTSDASRSDVDLMFASRWPSSGFARGTPNPGPSSAGR